MSREQDSAISELDGMVGRVAGAICTTLLEFPELGKMPLSFIPGISFKVKKNLCRLSSFQYLTIDQKEKISKEIQVAVVPILLLYEISTDVVEKVTPAIESAVVKALTKKDGEI